MPFLVPEYVPGETLQQRLDRTDPMDAEEAVWINRQLAKGLAAAHGIGQTHRASKPANNLLEAGPCLEINDFGLARVDDASVTQSGLGTYGPRSPNGSQALGRYSISPDEAWGLPCSPRSCQGKMIWIVLLEPLRVFDSGGNRKAIIRRQRSMDPKPHPQHEAYLRILRAMTPQQRLQKAFELSDYSKALFKQGLRERYPDLSTEEFHRLYLDRLAKCHNSNY